MIVRKRISNPLVQAAVLERDVDLRRKRGRDLAETVVARAAWVLPEDRALLEAMYRDGMSASDLARLSGKSPRSVRQRVRSVVTNVLSPRFAFVAGRRDGWPVRRRRVATACVLQGRTMRDTARHLKLTLHTVRMEMAVINAMYDTNSAGSTSAFSADDQPRGAVERSGAVHGRARSSQPVQAKPAGWRK